MRTSATVLSILTFPALLAACQAGSDPKALGESAQFFLNNGGLALISSENQAYSRPCLDSINLKMTYVGGLGLGTSRTLIKFIEDHDLAQTRWEAPSGGYRRVTITPNPKYETNWIRSGDYASFCFGTLTLVRAEAVADAKSVTAGAGEPYIIPGTEARATRITFRLDDVPGGDFADDLTQNRAVLTRNAMQPEDYGKDITVVAVIPTKTENYSVKP